jgi:protein CpxP
MNKTKLFAWIIIGLIVTNLLTVFLFAIPKKEQHNGPRNLIIKKLGFDDEQIQQYDSIIKNHRKAIAANNQKILENKKALYKMLEEQDNPKKTDSLTSEIGQLQKEIELIHYHHYQDIKKITRPNQLEKYNQFTKEITDIFFQLKK